MNANASDRKSGAFLFNELNHGWTQMDTDAEKT